MQNLLSGKLATIYHQYVDPYSSADSQVGRPVPYKWASINHTIVILEPNVVESIMTVKVLEAPWMKNDTIQLSFDDPHTYTHDDPLPEVLSGNLSWRGIFDVDLHVNDTVVIWTQLRFNYDATYHVHGWVFSEATGGYEGFGTSYYFYVEHGEIVRVTDKRDTPTTTQADAEKYP